MAESGPFVGLYNIGRPICIVKYVNCCLFITAALFLITTPAFATGNSKDDEPDRKPTKCEVCKYLSSELDVRLGESGRTHEVLTLDYRIDGGKQPRRKKKYRDSETRLIEALDDPPVCDEILKYNVHAEREGSLRYAKGMSETMQTLHGLRDKGVKVELGIPYEMWDSTHAEISDMKRQCEQMKEAYEEVIEEWYFHHQADTPLNQYLCEGHVLSAHDTGCLSEVDMPNAKGDTGDIDRDTDRKQVTKKKSKAKKTKKKKLDDAQKEKITEEQKEKITEEQKEKVTEEQKEVTEERDEL